MGTALLRAVVGLGLAVLLVASLTLAAARVIPWMLFWLAAAVCLGGAWLLRKTTAADTNL